MLRGGLGTGRGAQGCGGRRERKWVKNKEKKAKEMAAVKVEGRDVKT